MGNCVSVSVPADKLVTQCKDSIVEQLRYKAKLEDDLHRLITETEKLSERKRDVEREVVLAEKQLSMRRLDAVDGWLKRAEDAEIKVDELKTGGPRELANLCFGGLCYKNLFKCSSKFREKVNEMLATVATLKEEGKFGSVAAETIQDDLVCERPCETTKMGPESTFDQVWKFVEEEQVGVFGLYGLAGIGKTTLLKKINNKLGKALGDYVVIWISVDGQLELGKIQDQIAKQINLFDESSWTSKSFEEKASCIHKVLSRRKFVLLLDDIWERVDFIKAGVPHPNLENKSKVVFTTRLVEVCGHMEADEQFKVECWTEEEGLELLRSTVGDRTLESHHEIPELARILAKECGGLPLALVHIARGMARKRTPYEWEHAIGILRSSAYEFQGMGEKVFSVLKLSYDRLSSDTIRSCFEYCSLFPKGHRISRRELIDCWISEGLLDDKIGLQSDGYHKIGVLVNACLLEEVDNDCVIMHNVIRNMALWITTKPKEMEDKKETGNFYVQAGNELTEMPDIGEWQKVKKMSVMDNQIENVMEIPTCPDLRTLFLNGNRLNAIGGGFFQAMHNLQVLNLSNNPFLIELPSEIVCLVSLQHLDVSITSIKELPIELKSLLQIKCLNLEHTSQLQTIPQQFLSGFPNLQVLRMLECGSSSMQAVEDNVLYSENAKVFKEELPSLKRLTMLTITLKSSHAFMSFFNSKKLLNCTQSLKLQSLPDQKYLKARSADFQALDTLHVLDCKDLEDFRIDFPLELLSKREPSGFRSLRTVIISSCFKLRDLTWLILAPELKILVVSSCLNMRKIIDEGKLFDIPARMRSSTIPFSKLESLELQHLENLHSIHTTSLLVRQLKKIKVIGCPELKTLPLDSNSAQGGRIVIEGEQQWWGRLVWEDETTQNAFSPCFVNS